MKADQPGKDVLPGRRTLRELQNEGFQANIQIYLAAVAPYYCCRPQCNKHQRSFVTKFYDDYTAAEGDDGSGGTARLD